MKKRFVINQLAKKFPNLIEITIGDSGFLRRYALSIDSYLINAQGGA
jgi:hypothetical protein